MRDIEISLSRAMKVFPMEKDSDSEEFSDPEDSSSSFPSSSSQSEYMCMLYCFLLVSIVHHIIIVFTINLISLL